MSLNEFAFNKMLEITSEPDPGAGLLTDSDSSIDKAPVLPEAMFGIYNP